MTRAVDELGRPGAGRGEAHDQHGVLGVGQHVPQMVQHPPADGMPDAEITMHGIRGVVDPHGLLRGAQLVQRVGVERVGFR